MTYLQQIIEQFPGAANWQQQYPWFATGHLVAAFNNKETPGFETAAQRAAIFMNDIPRLHWLLHQPVEEKYERIHSPEEANRNPVPVLDAAAIMANQPSFQIDLSGPPDAEEPTEDETEAAGRNVGLSGSLAEAANSFKSSEPVDNTPLFETAYQHTIDYFASQGIKLEGEPALDDRFGQQLKTFTSWLRQMKRLDSTPDHTTEPLIDTHAAHSLQTSDVLTEPMVDILLKQGKKQQAMEVLEKLRLLHPEKSLYFAARSEQIKHSK